MQNDGVPCSNQRQVYHNNHAYESYYTDDWMEDPDGRWLVHVVTSTTTATTTTSTWLRGIDTYLTQ